MTPTEACWTSPFHHPARAATRGHTRLLRLLVAAVALTGSACRTPTGNQSAVRDSVATGSQATQYVGLMDSGCAKSNCHASGTTGKLPLTTLQDFATLTAPYQQCFNQYNCYDGLTTPATAKQCWQKCVTEAGGLSGDGGIFQAAVRTGFVRQLGTAAGIDSGTLNDMFAMPPMAPAAGDTNFASDVTTFRHLADFLTAEAGNNFATISTIRSAVGTTVGGSGTSPNTCDQFAADITSTINPDFHLDNVSMWGCPGGGWPNDPNACLTQLADTNWANPANAGFKVKILRRLTGRPHTSYWTRSSADGRFSSTGNRRMEDYATPNRSIVVQTQAEYDPIYSPDNNFYAWTDQICPQAKIYNTALNTVGPNIAASGCIGQYVSVYRSLGTDLNGEILAISGYTNNNPGIGTPDSSDMPGPNGGFTINRIVNNLITPAVLQFTIPNETDYEMAPSSSLVVGRFINDNGKQAYRVRALRPDGHTINPTDPNSTGVICMGGEKANISFDNRFIVFHHYVDPSVTPALPQDAGASPGDANIYIYDLKMKTGTRITNMSGGNNAYYPHFRADGWIYFLIKGADGVESTAASNAALVMAAANP